MEFSYLIQHTRAWAKSARPLPEHVKWVPYYEPGKYDFALLHVDQQCLLPDLGKSILFREVKAQIKDVPIIVINHGTPIYPERFTLEAEKEGYRLTEMAAEEWASKKMAELLEGASVMVVNSCVAKDMWEKGNPSMPVKTIIHGFDSKEWYDLPKEPRSITVVSPAGIGDKYYGRRLLHETMQILKEKYGIQHIWIGGGLGSAGGMDFAPDWDTYRKYLGRSLVYFNPTFGSPMPRSRSEAMMSGCCVITTRHQDADTFIKDGINGFIIRDNPEEAAEKIAELIFDYKRAIQIGKNGKETAIKLFSGERFRSDWINLIDKVIDEYERK